MMPAWLKQSEWEMMLEMREERFRRVKSDRDLKAMVIALKFTQSEMKIHWRVWS